MTVKLNNSDTTFQCFPRERFFQPNSYVSLSLIICVYSLYYAYLISFEIRCSDRGCNLVFFSNVLNRWGLELHSYEKMSPHKHLFKQKSQRLFDDCHTPFDLLFISAFASLFTESFAKTKGLLRAVKTSSSPRNTCENVWTDLCHSCVFFWWSDSDPGRKKPIFWGLAQQSLKTASVL